MQGFKKSKHFLPLQYKLSEPEKINEDKTTFFCKPNLALKKSNKATQQHSQNKIK